VLAASGDLDPSFFEATTAAAFLAFARTDADACILEVGLGGRLDATNVIDQPLVTGIASLGLDHQQFLGDDIRSIAREKAGIARRGVPLVVLGQDREAEAEIERAAAESGAILQLEGRDWLPDLGLKPAMELALHVAPQVPQALHVERGPQHLRTGLDLGDLLFELGRFVGQILAERRHVAPAALRFGVFDKLSL
jgi:folylpolyglutamate synthase/dihydrofolate synthase